MNKDNFVYEITITGNDDTVIKQIVIYDEASSANAALDDLQNKKKECYIKDFNVKAISITKDTCVDDLINSGYNLTLGDLAKLLKMVSNN